MKSPVFFPFLLILAALCLSSCRKENPAEPVKAIPDSMEELKIAPTFSWETTRTINITVRSGVSGVVYIQPADGNEYYHKGMVTRGADYPVVIRIPTSAEEIRLSLTGNTRIVKAVEGIITVQF